MVDTGSGEERKLDDDGGSELHCCSGGREKEGGKNYTGLGRGVMILPVLK